MFGLFKQKSFKPTVTAGDKDWVEKNILWFIEAFGLAKLKERPFILPTPDTFPYSDLKDSDQFHKLFEQLCACWEVNPGEIDVKFFDDIKSKEWTNLAPQGPTTEPLGLYYRPYTKEEKRFRINVAKSNLGHPQLLVAVIAHELAHVKLLGGNYIRHTDPDMEPLTDLASIFFGFGLFVANTCQIQDAYWIGRSGYLSNELISYSNAIICYVSGHDIQTCLPFLNTNTKALFKQDHEYLANTGDTILTGDEVSRREAVFETSRQMAEGFGKRMFDQVIEACEKLLRVNPKNPNAYNSLGYALLSQKKYEEAIEVFTKAITIDPYGDYPYNNRGYCKLQLGPPDNAFADIHSALEMNPGNSFAWRNMGAYYLAVSDYEQALVHFEEAEKIDPKTELVNFYLGQVYLKLENSDKAKFYLDRSKEINEYNYSKTG
jgi:tetratricopeptide (TPR) repeat protein